MKMQKRDWYDYLDFLRGQVQGKDLVAPKTIGEAYNNHMVMQDLEDVKFNKIGVARDSAQS